MRIVLALLAAAAAAVPAAAQQAPAPAAGLSSPQPDVSMFRRLDWPAATVYRSGSGMPGPRYWQQRVDYRIRASLDTVTNLLEGEETITYTNNSPDTLRYLWLQLDQNLFRADSRGALAAPPRQRPAPGSPEGGFTIQSVRQAAVAAARGRPAQRAQDLETRLNGTMMRVELPRPLAPGNRNVVTVAWSFAFLDQIAVRMGIEKVDGSYVYEVAQWYPRLAVYDDVRGWNTDQYLGSGEFYLEYGSFDVSLTVPANMIVAATGTLQNPEAVLTAAQRERLAAARRSDTTVVIRGIDEIDDPASRPASAGGSLTWRFAADSVRDFAWAAARHFIWDAARANQGRTLVMSLYPPSADSIWNQATQYGKTAIENYSIQWFTYPYPVAINVNGREGGMEYPMIVFCANRTNAPALYSVTDHEFGHQWYPMIVGNDERRYPWMDEGFNTFQNYYNWLKQYPTAFNRRANVDIYLRTIATGGDEPVMTPPDRQRSLGSTAYNKPGLALRLLRDYVVGPQQFDAAFREYIRRWAFKHPQPQDFFRTMEDGLGEDLSWYWRGWFYLQTSLDQAVDSVGTDSTSGTSLVYLQNRGAMVMPVLLDAMMADGTTRHIKLPADIWMRGDRYIATIPGPARVSSVTIDADNSFPDVDRANNKWPRLPGQ
ncbi:MAG: M1 family metallopeptidase [Gemmatimonadales bacterium]